MDISKNDLKHLFVTWLEELVADAERKNSNTLSSLNQAVSNLRKFEGNIVGPQSLLGISYLGEKRVNFLIKQLRKFCKNEGYSVPQGFEERQRPHLTRDPLLSSLPNGIARKAPSKKAKTKKKYVPAKRSGGYAILVTLGIYDPDSRGMTKDEIISKAGNYCDNSFSANPATKHYHSAWSSSKTLINNGLVKCTGRPLYYYLTEEGADLAKVLISSGNYDTHQGERRNAPQKRGVTPMEKDAQIQSLNTKRSLDDLYSNDPHNEENPRKRNGLGILISNDFNNNINSNSLSPTSKSPIGNDNITKWNLGTFEIIFIIDNRELRSGNDKEFFYSRLKNSGFKVEMRALSVGDFLWIARHKETLEEVILDFILERKRLDDLVSSIQDGRFSEQKHRLSMTGIRNIFYLIDENAGVDLSAFNEQIKTLISQAVVENKFFVERCRDSDSATMFLEKLTKRIVNYYLLKDIVAIRPKWIGQQTDFKKILFEYRKKYIGVECCLSYGSFIESLGKTSFVTVKELYLKMLLTTKGVSFEKALVIQNNYSTPKKLIEAYKSLGDDEAKKKSLLKDVSANEVGNRSIGKKTSENIYEAWGKYY